MDSAPYKGIHRGWHGQRIDTLRWVLRVKGEADADETHAVFGATGDRPIVEFSTRDHWYGPQPVTNRYEGRNVLGRL